MPKKYQIRRLPTKRYPDWDETGMIFTCDGKDFVLTPTLRTRCIGKPDYITPESQPNQNLGV